MSHETLASTWSALIDLPDLTAGLRDVVGYSTLRQIRSSYHPEETPRRFLQYAHELSQVFDSIRFLCKTDSKATQLLQEDLVSAVAHFLISLANDCVNAQTVLNDSSHKLILGHAFCSAVAALRSCAWDCRPELRAVLYRHAGQLLTNAPVKDDSLWLLQTLSNLLVEHYAAAIPLGQGNDQSNTRWKMLWEAKNNRSDIIQDMVRRATDSNVASAERILPMLDLCQLYWDTDALLVQSSAGLNRQKWLDRIFYVPSDLDAVKLAMEVRFKIQEQFVLRRNMRSSSNVDNLQVQSYVMFRPGLRLACASDECQCNFDSKVRGSIAEARTQQNSLLRSMVSAAYNDLACIGMPDNFFDTIHLSLAQRLRRSVVQGNQAMPQTPEQSSEEDEPVAEVMPLRPRLPSSQSADNAVVPASNFKAKPRSASQPGIHRRFSRPKGPSGTRIVEWKSSSNVALHTQIEEKQFVESAPDLKTETQAEVTSPFSFTSPSPTAPDFGRADSVTTTSTSTGYRSHHSHIPKIATMISEKELEHAFPEPVSISADHHPLQSPFVPTPFVLSPHDFEPSYPEVAIDPVTAIQEDNMSLFSDGGSMPMTTRSGSNAGGRMLSQKKFSLFNKAGKKGGSSFAVPTVRFFASGRHMVAWTRYGGVCFDVNNPENTKVHSINSGDIVLAVGGSRRFAVIARYQEAYTLCVYNLGDVDPGLKINLGSCPKAMDISKNDEFLAIKYTQGVRIFDLDKATKIDHKLPKMECANSPPGGHLVVFSHDSQSFMASTRMGPEKVLTYWSLCMDRTKSVMVHSNAPCGNIDDHGLTCLALAGPSVRGIATGFLSTFTEKGSPVILSMNEQQPQAILLRGSRDAIGTRIHGAGMHVDPHTKRSNLVLVNQSNEIFWISDLFGRGQEIQKIKTLKRPKSMKPEIMVAMSNSDDCNIFWVDQKSQCGWLTKVGKSGGMTKPVEIRLDIEPMCSG